MKRNIFSLRAEYLEYLGECAEAGEQPWRFKDWFLTVFHYEIADNSPLF